MAMRPNDPYAPDANPAPDPTATADPTAPPGVTPGSRPMQFQGQTVWISPDADWLNKHTDSRLSPVEWQDRINSAGPGGYDPGTHKFKTHRTLPGGELPSNVDPWVDKPEDAPAGYAAWGDYMLPTADPRVGGGGGGGAGGPGGGGGAGGAGLPAGQTSPLPKLDVPDFTAPAYEPPPTFVAPKFNAPNAQDVLSDPGYQFRLNQGVGALEASAAARGTLRTGGTLKDIMGYGQEYASKEYGDVYNRALQGYGTEYQGAQDMYKSQYQTAKDAYEAKWSGAKEEYAPQYAESMANFNRDWDVYNLGTSTGLQRDLAEKNADLQRYLQKQGFINNLLTPSVPGL